jgi:serine kinase of HPr protein (carbohydrate metabolism regulator)
MISDRISDTASNYHCSVVELAGKGILIEGGSGSGKTSLAFALIEAAQNRGLSAIFVSDDQALLSLRAGKLVARAPETIRGKAEIYGLGIVSVPFREAATIELVVRLLPASRIERLPCEAKSKLAGSDTPQIDAPENAESHATRMVLGKLGLI